LVVLLIRWLRVGHFWEQGKEGRLLPSQVPEADARLRWVAVALALLLTTTPEAYSVLLGLVVALWPLRHTLAQAWHDVGGKARHRAAALFLLLIGAIGSVFLTDIPALGNVADLLGQWVRSWWESGGYPWYWVPFRVLADEPLLAGLALWGAWRAWRRGNVLDRVWLRWAVVLLLLGFRPGRTSADVVVLLIPLTFLAADALRAGWEMLRAPSPTWREEGVLTAAFLIILVFLSMMFAGYVASGESRYIPALIVVPLLLVGLAFLYGFWLGKRAALRVVFTCALITGLVWTWMAFWVQNLHLAPDAALDALPGIERETTYPDIRLLVRMVERISAERNTDLHEIPLDLMSEGDDVLRWYFRDFKNLREIPSLKSATAPVVLAPTTVGELPNYTGMDWVTRRAVLPTDLGGRIYHWWLYRESAFPQPTTNVVLWYAAETPQGKDGE
ncbi:MAG: hypothetical protein GXO55_08225, partial [Chloroflexi bacterium]|nr:hypothetical protein [Chloroflexota bacterium]